MQSALTSEVRVKSHILYTIAGCLLAALALLVFGLRPRAPGPSPTPAGPGAETNVWGGIAKWYATNQYLAQLSTNNAAFQACTASQARAADSPYGKPDDLPPGVPHAVDTNGNVFSIEPMFTTQAFQEEGLRLIIEEANRVARDMHLRESLPIATSNLTHAFIAPFGYTYIRKRLGNVTTTNYFHCHPIEI
jgi:hypothetical protein